MLRLRVRPRGGERKGWPRPTRRLRLEPLESRNLLAVTPLDGVNFSPYIASGEDPDKGDGQITDAELWQRMEAIAEYTDSFRSFGCNEDLKEVGQFAHALGAEAIVGAWIGSDTVENQSQIDCLIEQATLGHVDMAIVGSEVLLRNDVTEETLIGYINDVKSSLATAGVNIPVTTADVYGELLAHPAVLDAVDVVLANYYPFWEGSSVETAVARVHRWHQQVIAAAGGKDVVVSETGWPSAGESLGDAVPSPENAAFYFLNFVSWARAENVDYSYFEAYDEPWKTKYEGERGAYWGVFDTSMDLKPGMEAVFNGDTMEDNWSNPPTPPIVDFMTMPEAVTTNIGMFVVTGTTDADHVVKVNGEMLPSTSFGAKGEFAHTVVLTKGQNTVVLEIEDSVGAQIATSTKSILFDPGFSTEDHNLLYVDVVPGDSTAPALDGTVVVDVDGNTILGVLPYHARGRSPLGTEVYMEDRSVVSTTNHQVTRTLPFSSDIPLSGFLVSPNGDRLYSRNETVDVASNTLLATRLPVDITTGSSWASAAIPGGPAITADGTTIYAGNSVDEIDPSTGTATATGITGLYMSDIAVSPDGSSLLVSEYSYNSGRLDIYDRATFEPLKTVGGIGDFSGKIIFLTDTLAVVGSAGNPAYGSGVVSVVDLSTYTVVQQIPISLADNLVVARDEREVYASTGMSDALLGDRFGIDVLALGEDGRLYRTKTICLGVNAFSTGTGRPRNDQIRRVLVKPAAPEVVSVYVTDSMVTDVDTGPGAAFGVTIEFSKPMTIDGTADPIVLFDPSVAATLTLNSDLSRWLSEYRYQAVYDVVDVNVDIRDITIGVADAEDTAGNPLQEYTPEIKFSIDTLSDTLPPTAIAGTSPITVGNSEPQTITVVFSDDEAVAVASIGDGDIAVTGPSGYREIGRLVPGTISPATDGTPITAEYTVLPPGTMWDVSDNGTYVVSLLANEVSDTSDNLVSTEEIGGFNVNVADMVELLGTPASDTFHFTKLANEFIVTVNGIPQSFDASITTIYVDTLGDDDSITFEGTDQEETVMLRPGFIDVIGQTYELHAVSVENITANSGTGNDQVTMSGSAGSNRLYSYAGYARLTDSPRTFSFRVDGFDDVTVAAPSSGRDYAFLYDSPDNDVLDASPDRVILNRAVGAADATTTTATGFLRAYAYGTGGGTDAATLSGSDTTRNRFYGYADYSILTESRRSFYFYARGFEAVAANSPGDGYTYAYLHDSSGVDSLTATPATATMDRAAGWSDTTASGFKRVYAYSTRGGDDSAELSGSSTEGNRFRGRPTYSTLTDTARSFYHYARGFRWLTAEGSATDPSSDRAYLYDSKGADTLEGRGDSAILKDTAETTYQIEALYFDLVYARSSDRTTNDTVDVDDSLVYNLIRTGTW